MVCIRKLPSWKRKISLTYTARVSRKCDKNIKEIEEIKRVNSDLEELSQRLEQESMAILSRIENMQLNLNILIRKRKRESLKNMEHKIDNFLDTPITEEMIKQNLSNKIAEKMLHFGKKDLIGKLVPKQASSEVQRQNTGGT